MGFARRLLTSIGVGAATVDTRLETEEVSPGEEIRGVVELKGGDSAQEIDAINLEVQTDYKRESGDTTVRETATIERFSVASAMTVEPKAQDQIPFSFRLPYDTPLTLGRSTVWIRTALDVKMAVDPSDRDPITVRPDATTRTILDAVQELGFVLREAENEELPYHHRRRMVFAQEFEFVARSGEFRGRLDELEMVMFPSEGEVELMLQVDRRARDLGSFLSESLGTDESQVRLTISREEVERGADHVAKILADAIRKRS